MKKTYYYSDEINDDFAGTNIKRKELPADYPYFSSNPVRKFFEFILYRLIVTPLIFLFQKIVFREKFKNKKVLKKYRKNGYFIYANHTSAVSDAFTPTLVTFPKKAYILINPDGVSIPVVGKAVEMLGGVPLPTHRRGMKNFHDAVLSHAQKRHCIVIYPEAHIWPYYTKIRPFKDVSFRYPNTETYALRHVSLRFRIGERLAVVGMNGSGKTTFIKLLCRLYDPTEGVILLNGVDIRKYNYDEYLSIFSVDKAGMEISGGEAQKIALARALYKNAPFIVLDEPTAALDPVSEYEVYRKFNEISGGRTAVYISHRLASCRFCDEILVFHEGQIVQHGAHEALLAESGGKYAELWNAQAQYYTDAQAGAEV